VWAGPLSRELLAFNSFIKALNRSLRNLCEMLTLSLFLNSDRRKDRGDYLEIALRSVVPAVSGNDKQYD